MSEYSTIRIANLKAHVYNHSTRRIVCGVDHWKYTPFTINKTKYDVATMLQRHHAFAERRPINRYKYTCVQCERKLEVLNGKENNN